MPTGSNIHDIPKLSLHNGKELELQAPSEMSYLLVCWWLSSLAPWRETAGWCPATWSNPLGSSAGKTPPAPRRGTAEQMLSQQANPWGGRPGRSHIQREAGPPWQVIPWMCPMMGSSFHFCTARAILCEETTLPKASSSNNQFASWHTYTIINLSNDELTKLKPNPSVGARSLIFTIIIINAIKYLICAGQSVTTLSKPPNSPERWTCSWYPCFIDGETESQKSQVPCPDSHNWKKRGRRIQPQGKQWNIAAKSCFWNMTYLNSNPRFITLMSIYYINAQADSNK